MHTDGKAPVKIEGKGNVLLRSTDDTGHMLSALDVSAMWSGSASRTEEVAACLPPWDSVLLCFVLTEPPKISSFILKLLTK